MPHITTLLTENIRYFRMETEFCREGLYNPNVFFFVDAGYKTAVSIQNRMFRGGTLGIRLGSTSQRAPDPSGAQRYMGIGQQTSLIRSNQ